MLVPLQSLIKQTSEDTGRLQQILSSFSCTRDHDIESFIREKAIEFENLSKARTYLIFDEEQMIRHSNLMLLGYISLALKVLHVPDGLSIRNRRELDGFRGKIKGEPIRYIPCYLIGQLARNDTSSREQISGKDLIEEAHRIIVNSVEAVGGRFMMIECLDDDKLIKFYQDNGFKEISRIPDGDRKMVQMLRKLVDDD